MAAASLAPLLVLADVTGLGITRATPAGKAARLRAAGHAAMDELRFRNAIAAYERAYALTRDPALLFNPPRASRELADHVTALPRDRSGVLPRVPTVMRGARVAIPRGPADRCAEGICRTAYIPNSERCRMPKDCTEGTLEISDSDGTCHTAVDASDQRRDQPVSGG